MMRNHRELLLALFSILLLVQASKKTTYSKCIMPTQIHTSIAGSNSDDINIAWTTFDSSSHSNYAPTVMWKTASQNHEDSVFTTDAKCTTKSYVTGVYHHDCTIGPITPQTTYLYSVGDANCYDSFSPATDITPQPKRGQDVTVAFFGDMGTENMAGTLSSLANDVKLGRISMAVHLGDISYADNLEHIRENKNVKDRAGDYERVMNEFFDNIEPVAKNLPYLVTPGNHDVTCLIYGDAGCPRNLMNFTAYNSRWRMIGHDLNPIEDKIHANGNMWYSFVHGNIHFISINTETDYPSSPYVPNGEETKAGGFSGNQIAWLTRELEKAASWRTKKRPWIIVYGHRPLYSTSRVDYPPQQENRTREVFEPLFQKYGVDMYISGHVHLFERTFPLLNGRITSRSYENPESPVYVVNGAAGNQEGHFTNVTSLPDHVPYRNMDSYGYSILQTKTYNTQSSKEYYEACHYFIAGFEDMNNPLDKFCITKTKVLP